MVILKQIRASTLMETLVATVLIVIIFMMASMLLNSLFFSGIRNNSSGLEERITELEYSLLNGGIETPYEEEWGKWKIEVKKSNGQAGQAAIFRALLKDEPSRVYKSIIYGS